MNKVDIYAPFLNTFGEYGPTEKEYWDEIGAQMDCLVRAATQQDVLKAQNEIKEGSLADYYLKQAHLHWITDHDNYMLNLIEAYKAHHAPNVQMKVNEHFILKAAKNAGWQNFEKVAP